MISDQNTFLIPTVLLILAFFSIILSLFALLKISRVNKRSRIFFSGKNAKNLEGIIEEQSKKMQNLDKEIQELFEISNKLHRLAFKSIHKFGIVRFNPFKDIGGDQSFALALLDGRNNGIVISSLHTREGTRVYSKPISKGVPEKHTLTEEEKEAIEIAKAQNSR